MFLDIRKNRHRVTELIKDIKCPSSRDILYPLVTYYTPEYNYKNGHIDVPCS